MKKAHVIAVLVGVVAASALFMLVRPRAVTTDIPSHSQSETSKQSDRTRVELQQRVDEENKRTLEKMEKMWGPAPGTKTTPKGKE